MSIPFLSRVPRKYLEDPEERRFWEYLIGYLDNASGDSSGETTSNTQAVEDAIAIAVSSASVVDRTEVDPTFANETTTFTSGNLFPELTTERVNETLVSGGTHFATDGDYIVATNAPTIVLPDNPGNLDAIYIEQADNNTTTIISNNKKIIDTNQIQITVKDSQYTLRYRVRIDYWSVA